MECTICFKEKLRKEFPQKALSDECDHPPLYCLRCAVAVGNTDKICPYENCGEPVDASRVLEFEQILEYLFPKVQSTQLDISDVERSGEQVFVATLDGERTAIPYSPDMTVEVLQEQIEAKMKVETTKQKLIFQDTDLEVFSESGDLMVLGDYSIPKGATIHLMVLLYAISEHMDHVIFDLSWGYPKTGRDFLDASCIIFSKMFHRGTVNYDKKSWPISVAGVQHSGDGMDDANCRGYHTIDVFLKKVPADVTHLFFTLSVFSSPSIAHFQSPILRFYDAANKAKDLCNTSLSEASDSEAVVMCLVVRKSNKKGWDIYESGQLSDGNVNNYDPLCQTAEGIIQGLFKKKVGKSVVRSNVAPPISAVRSVVSSGPRIVEIAFCFDTTGSMHRCIDEVKKNVREIISKLLEEMPNLRIAVFAHGDHDCPDPYVTKHIDFSNDVNKLSKFVRGVEGTRGGGAECYEFALFEMRRKLSWSEQSNKSIVMIGDAYPHLPDDPVNIPNVDWKVEVKRLFTEKGVRIYAVQCQTHMTRRSKSNVFWKELAVLGHGKHLLLNNFGMVIDLLLAICYREAAPSLLKKFESELRGRASADTSMSSILDTLQ